MPSMWPCRYSNLTTLLRAGRFSRGPRGVLARARISFYSQLLLWIRAVYSQKGNQMHKLNGTSYVPRPSQ